MKILYNPPTGAPIGEGHNNWYYEGSLLEAHEPGELKQYPDQLADAIVDTFRFVKEVDPDEAQKILKDPNKFKCDKCDFSSNTQIALLGHMKKHEKEQRIKDSIPLVDPSLIPVGGQGERVTPNKSANSNTDPRMSDEEMKTRNGVDKDGVEWYGEGVKEEKKSFSGLRPANKGHFGRQKLNDN